jgi:hypothetical protein
MLNNTHRTPLRYNISDFFSSLLERELDTVIAEWLLRVEKDPELMSISMIHKDRTGHLPHLLHDVIGRLRLAVC